MTYTRRLYDSLNAQYQDAMAAGHLPGLLAVAQNMPEGGYGHGPRSVPGNAYPAAAEDLMRAHMFGEDLRGRGTAERTSGVPAPGLEPAADLFSPAPLAPSGYPSVSQGPWIGTPPLPPMQPAPGARMSPFPGSRWNMDRDNPVIRATRSSRYFGPGEEVGDYTGRYAIGAPGGRPHGMSVQSGGKGARLDDPNRGSFADVLLDEWGLIPQDIAAGVGRGFEALFTDETVGQAFQRGRDEKRIDLDAYRRRNPGLSYLVHWPSPAAFRAILTGNTRPEAAAYLHADQARKAAILESAPSAEAFDGQTRRWAEQSGLGLSESDFAAFADAVKGDRAFELINDRQHPSAYEARHEIMKWRGHAPTVADLMDIRAQMEKLADNARNKHDAKYASQLIGRLDDLVASYSRISSAWRPAGELWNRGIKSRLTEDMINRALASEDGFHQALRGEVDTIRQDPRKRALFTDEEFRSLERGAEGGHIENALNMLGFLSVRNPVNSFLATGGARFAARSVPVAVPVTGGAIAASTAADLAGERQTNREAAYLQALMRASPRERALSGLAGDRMSLPEALYRRYLGWGYQ